ncbi:hypothetical protein Hanom_Chr02g00176741 [Helianthus anomalus]
MAAADPDCAVAVAPVAVDVGASVRAKTSGSVGRRSFKRTKPDVAGFTGAYLLSSRNLMNFSCAGTTLAGFVKISNVGSGSAFFSFSVAASSTCWMHSQRFYILFRSAILTDSLTKRG